MEYSVCFEAVGSIFAKSLWPTFVSQARALTRLLEDFRLFSGTWKDLERVAGGWRAILMGFGEPASSTIISAPSLSASPPISPMISATLSS
jgi:hypothetical protein